MPLCNSKFKVHNSKLWLGRVDEWTGWQVDWLFVLWNRTPQCRDRRPRLSASTFHLTLQAASLMRTDEGVCPYFLTLSLIKETPSSLWRGRFLAMKRASLRCEETPSLFANNAIYSPLHSERGRGWGWLLTGVRLLFSPWGRLGAAVEEVRWSLKITCDHLTCYRCVQ